MKTSTFKIISLVLLALIILPSISAAADYDLSKALVIGSGPKKVIEFTDPDCPFCRRASIYFDSRRDVTRYVFFTPLASHPHAKRKVQYLLSQNDMVKAYHDVMSGLFDNAPPMKLPVSEKGIKLQEAQHEIAKKSGINATPTFIISGRIIEGFEQQKIHELLGK